MTHGVSDRRRDVASSVSFEFDLAARVISWNSRTVRLSRQEATLLAVVARHAPWSVVTHEEIGRALDPEHKLLDVALSARVAVTRLRNRLKASQIPLSIGTVHGAGYVVDQKIILRGERPIMLDKAGGRLVRRLIQECSDPWLAERARQVVFGE